MENICFYELAFVYQQQETENTSFFLQDHACSVWVIKVFDHIVPEALKPVSNRNDKLDLSGTTSF